MGHVAGCTASVRVTECTRSAVATGWWPQDSNGISRSVRREHAARWMLALSRRKSTRRVEVEVEVRRTQPEPGSPPTSWRGCTRPSHGGMPRAKP
jgi:hypothetical protein